MLHSKEVVAFSTVDIEDKDWVEDKENGTLHYDFNYQFKYGELPAVYVTAEPSKILYYGFKSTPLSDTGLRVGCQIVNKTQ